MNSMTRRRRKLRLASDHELMDYVGGLRVEAGKGLLLDSGALMHRGIGNRRPTFFLSITSTPSVHPLPQNRRYATTIS